jgi:hypothetical protein
MFICKGTGKMELEKQVVIRAREIASQNNITWKEALLKAAEELCFGWDWIISEFISGKYENASFHLTQYRG